MTVDGRPSTMTELAPIEHMASQPSGLKSAVRTMDVLTFLAGRLRPVPTRTIALACGIPKSSAHALLNAMRARGFVTYYPAERAWAVGAAVSDIASGYLRARPLERIGRRVIRELALGEGSTATLSLLHGSDIIHVLVEGGPSSLVGARMPADSCASGRAILMMLSPTELLLACPPYTHIGRPGGAARFASRLTSERAAGYASDAPRTFASGAVAVPVRTKDGSLRASVTLHVEPDERAVAAVTGAAQRLSDQLDC